MQNIDYYEVLQVVPHADPEVIEVAYRRLAFKYHKDTGGQNASDEAMTLLNEAHRVPGDSSLRKAYDRERQRRRELDAHLQSGQTHFENGNVGEAAKAFLAALKLDPQSIEGHEGLAQCHFSAYLAQKNHDDKMRWMGYAVGEWQAILAIDPNHMKSLWWLGWMYDLLVHLG